MAATEPQSSAATAAAVQEEGSISSSPGKKLKGTVKWFNSSKGYGFITSGEAEGDEDVFVHQTAIHAQGFRSLQQGEEVEYVAEEGEDGRLRAVEVKGPKGAYVQGASRYGSRGSGRGRASSSSAASSVPVAGPRPIRGFRFSGVCYNCGLVGHMSRECRHSAAYYPPPPPSRGRGGGGHGGHLVPVDPRSCYSCGQVGHLQRDCPNFAP